MKALRFISVLLLLFFSGCISLIDEVPESSAGAQFVPNTDAFTLSQVVDAVRWHNPGTSGDLSSCFSNAISNFFDASYNNDSYAPANSMRRFRNYGPKNNVAITTSTNFLVTTPVTDAVVICYGGGGAGGGGGSANYSGGGGGGGGGFISVRGPISPNVGYSVTVATQVLGSGMDNNGGDGGYTSFTFDNGWFCSAYGGGGGKSYSNGGAGGAGGGFGKSFAISAINTSTGGTGANGTSTYSGGGGGGAGSSDGNNGFTINGGSGGDAIAGTGGEGSNLSSAGGTNGGIYGGGGGGATKTGISGRGAAGYVVVYW